MLIFKPVFPRSVNNYPQVILRHLSQVWHRLRNIPVLLIEVFKQALQSDNDQLQRGEMEANKSNSRIYEKNDALGGVLPQCHVSRGNSPHICPTGIRSRQSGNSWLWYNIQVSLGVTLSQRQGPIFKNIVFFIYYFKGYVVSQSI